MLTTSFAIAFSAAKAVAAAKAKKSREAQAAKAVKAWQDRLAALDWEKVLRVNTASPAGEMLAWVRAGMPRISAIKEVKEMFKFDLQMFAEQPELRVMDNGMWKVAMQDFLQNDNRDVGKVTVMHMPFANYLRQVNSGKVDEAAKFVQFVFGSSDESAEYASVASDLDCGLTLDAIQLQDTLVEVAMDRATHMRYTCEGIAALCEDFIAFGRMYQERTIDAAKKGGEVFIPYGEALDAVSIMSRKRGYNDYNVVVNFEAREVPEGWREAKVGDAQVSWVYDNKETRTFRVKGKEKLVINDSWHQVNLGCLKMTIEFAKELVSLKATFSPALKEFILKQHQANPWFHALCDLAVDYQKTYLTVNSWKAKKLAELKSIFEREEEYLEEEKAIKARCKEMFNALGNEVRRAFGYVSERMGYKPNYRWYAMALIYAGFTKGGQWVQSESAASGFADTTLGQEFTAFMASAMKKAGKPVAEVTFDSLSDCYGYEDGETAEFIAGIASKEDEEGNEIGYAETNEDLTGEFVIRNKDGKWYAEKDTLEALEEEVPSADPTRLMFVTKMDEKVGQNMGEFLVKAIRRGHQVQLVGCAICDGKKFGNSIVIDGEVVSHYRSTYIAWDSKVRSIVGDALNGWVGTVEDAFVSEQTTVVKGKTIKAPVAVVILKDVKKGPNRVNATVAQNLVEIPTIPSIPAKKFHRFNSSNAIVG